MNTNADYNELDDPLPFKIKHTNFILFKKKSILHLMLMTLKGKFPINVCGLHLLPFFLTSTICHISIKHYTILIHIEYTLDTHRIHT